MWGGGVPVKYWRVKRGDIHAEQYFSSNGPLLSRKVPYFFKILKTLQYFFIPLFSPKYFTLQYFRVNKYWVAFFIPLFSPLQYFWVALFSPNTLYLSGQLSLYLYLVQILATFLYTFHPEILYLHSCRIVFLFYTPARHPQLRTRRVRCWGSIRRSLKS